MGRAKDQIEREKWGTPDNRKGEQQFRQLGCNEGMSVMERRQSCAGSCLEVVNDRIAVGKAPIGKNVEVEPQTCGRVAVGVATVDWALDC